MDSPFTTQTPRPQGWVGKLLHRPHHAGAMAELRTLLAGRATDAVPPDRISAILSANRVSGKLARHTLLELWAEAATRFAADARLSTDESSYLDRLRLLLTLSQSDTDTMLASIGAEVLRRETTGATADSFLTADEWQRLNQIAAQFRIPDATVTSIHTAAVSGIYQAKLDRAIADRLLSPQEEKELAALATNLGITPNYDATTRGLLDRFRVIWRLQNEALPVVDVPIVLQRNEVCHFTTEADWYETRTRTTRVGYSGPVMTFHIAKGLSYRMASYKPSRITEDVLTKLDSGTLYVTNKRIIFDGARKNTAIRYSAMIGITPYADGIGIEKATGKCPVLAVRSDAEIAATVLCEALARST